MKSVLLDDVVALARALNVAPEPLRPDLAKRIVQEAKTAFRYAQCYGRAHSSFGDGTLMAAAMAHPQSAEGFACDPDFRRCLIQSLQALDCGG